MMIATWCSLLPSITSILHRPTGQGYRFPSALCFCPTWTATLKELKVYARLFIEAKAAEIKPWFDNDVFDPVDIRKFKPKNVVTGRWVLTVKRDRDGKFQKCKARGRQGLVSCSEIEEASLE